MPKFPMCACVAMDRVSMCTQKQNLCTTLHIVLNASKMCVCKHNCMGLVEVVRIRLDAHATSVACLSGERLQESVHYTWVKFHSIKRIVHLHNLRLWPLALHSYESWDIWEILGNYAGITVTKLVLSMTTETHKPTTYYFRLFLK